MKFKSLVIWNIVVTALLLGLVFNGCVAAPGNLDIKEQVDWNTAAVKSNRETIMELAKVSEETVNSNREVIRQLAGEVEINRDSIIELADINIDLVQEITNAFEKLEPVIEEYTQEYVDWYIEDKVRELVTRLILQMLP